MSGVKNVVLRFNLDDEAQRKGWEYLRTKDRGRFKSNSALVSTALAAFFEGPECSGSALSQESGEDFVERIVTGVTEALSKTLAVYLSGFVSGISQSVQAAPPKERAVKKPERPKENPNVDWQFVTGQGKVQKQSKF